MSKESYITLLAAVTLVLSALSLGITLVCDIYALFTNKPFTPYALSFYTCLAILLFSIYLLLPHASQ